MKKLLAAVTSGILAGAVLFGSGPDLPAQAQQGGAPPQELAARVATLEGELALERRRHEETRATLEATLVYLEKQAQAAQALLGVLDESEREGFAVGENWRSRQILLTGLRAYWGEVKGVPKLPAPERPAAPARPKAPARQ
ncbi:MAG TPA: hypothetical protein VF530_07850 [Planctomycetota bacterium]